MSDSEPTDRPPVRVIVLGAVGVTVGDEPLRLGGGRPRSILALLALDPGRVVTQDRLVEQLWPDDDASAARRTLQVHVGNLRKALRPAAKVLDVDQIVQTRPDGYALHAGPGIEYDLARFDSLAADGRRLASRGELSQAAERLQEALALCQGPPLDGLTDHPSLATAARPIAARIEDVRDDACDVLLQVDEAGAVLRLLERAADDLLRERRQALYAEALYRAGRQAEALDRLAQVRQHLMDELGLDPSPDVQELERQLLNHDLDSRDNAAPIHQEGTVLRASVIAPSGRLVGPFGHVALGAAATTVGRGDDQDIVVDDPQASRRHAVVRLTAAGFVIQDLLSTNGTVVNGQRIDEHPLADGDTIVVGTTRLRFEATPG